MNHPLQHLASQHCNDKAGKLQATDIPAMVANLPGWSFDEQAIVKMYKFKNYYETIAFVNAIAWIAHRENHHPDLTVSYNQCIVRYSSHSIGGLSQNDFICAAKADSLLEH